MSNLVGSMYLPIQKAFAIILTTHFALLAFGNVAMHQFVGKYACSCFSHGSGVSRLDSTDCGCETHSPTSRAAFTDSTNEKEDDTGCSLCRFFEQRVQVVHCLVVPTTVALAERKLNSCLQRSISPDRGAHLARGPPALS